MKDARISDEEGVNGPNPGVSPFYRTDWKPAEYHQLKEDKHKSFLKTRGYFVVENFFSSNTVSRLQGLYESVDHVGVNEIGMFVSAYSEDVEYRKTVHIEIQKIVEPELNKIFTSFKPILYNFVIKESRANLSLKLHQDLALTDENTSSPINIWMCMMDTNIENGAVHVVPKTQYFIPPHRSRSNEVVLGNLNSHLMKYAINVPLKKGDLLVFDSRLLHGSLPNVSGRDRYAAIGHICSEHEQLTMIKPSLTKEGLHDLIEIDREDLFNANGYESKNKSNFSGRLKSTIKLESFEITPEQLKNYFKRVKVPLTAQDLPSNTDSPKPSTQSNHNPMQSIINRISGWFQ